MSTEEIPLNIIVDNPDTKETDENFERHPMTTRSKSKQLDMYNSPRSRRHRTYEETSFITGKNERSPLLQEENQENREEAVRILKK